VKNSKRQRIPRVSPLARKEVGVPSRLPKIVDKAKTPRKVGRPPLEAPNAERRDSIAAAALKLFSESGFAAVSNRDLGAAAGIHPALIYHYFENRDDLFRFVVRKSLADALSAYDKVRQEQTKVGALDAWLSSNLLLIGDITRFLKLVIDYVYSPHRSAETDKAIASFYDTEVGLLTNALRDELDISPNRAHDLAQLLSVFLDGVMVARAVRPEIDTKRLLSSMRKLLSKKSAGPKPDRFRRGGGSG
jgi:AcrR family transcriptional regulator